MNRPAPWRSIMTSVADRRPFKVGGATVDPVSRDATWPGGSERLQPQTLKVLMALLSRRGEVVTRDELVQLCWDGRIVGDDVINRSILLLRHFAERAGGFEIETVPRAGYRLVEVEGQAKFIRRQWTIALSAAALIAVVAGGFLVRSERNPAGDRTLTIALLPFAATSSDADTRKLAAATREAVANTLAQGAYSVTALNAAPQGPSAPADFLISGQLTSTADKMVATVRMEETAHHVVVFSHEFETDRGKADDFPELIGAQVASQLSWTAPMLEIERRHPSDPAITASLLQASAAGLNGVGPLHDYETSRPLAMKDPNSPLAQTSFAFNTAFALDEIPREQREEAVAAARAAADRAVSLAPEFGDNYAPWCLLHSEQRKVECEGRLRAGMRADPDSPFANFFLSVLLAEVGRDQEAEELARASLAHDPYMPNKIGIMLRMLEVTGQTGESVELYRRAARWWPKSDAILWRRYSGMVAGGDFTGAQQFESEMGEPKGPSPVLAAINRNSPASIRASCSAAQHFDRVFCMLALARLGDFDGAYRFADSLYPSRRGRTLQEQDRIWLDDPDSFPLFFLTGPAAAPLRRDQRYVALAERVGLLEYWRSGRLPDFCTKAHEPVCKYLRPTRT